MRSAQSLVDCSLLVPSIQPEPLPIRAVEPAPCTQACPAGINVKAYVSLIAEGHFRQALQVVRERCPLPAVCGRICHHPCEGACERRAVDEPVAIRMLKRFVADLDFEEPAARSFTDNRNHGKVAVVGSGPAGLTAAWDLMQAGYAVTLFEAEDELGGMLRYGITEYRLPKAVLQTEIETICRAGLEVRTGCRIGRDLELEHLLESGYLATLLAVGAQEGKRLDSSGAFDSEDVVDALTFLRQVNEGNRTPIDGKVVVIGGGSTALEAARSALRLGAGQVDILYRRYREELLADAEEIAAAEAEGISFRFLVAPVQVRMEDGRLRAVQCVRVGLGEPDASGRRSPITIPGTEFWVEAGLVLVAVGQEVDLDFFPEELRPRLVHRGLIRTDNATTMTPCRGVFAAGDAVAGPTTVIDAIADGHRAASSIRRFLECGEAGVADQRPELRAAAELEFPDSPPLTALRVRPRLAGVQRGREFSEVEGTLREEEAVAEARRCLRCGPCGDCRSCAPSCRRRHIMIRSAGHSLVGESTTLLVRAPGSVALHLSTRQATPGRLLPEARPRLLGEIGAEEGQPVELLPVRASVEPASCRACGLCVEVCPFGAIEPGNPEAAGEAARIEPALCRGCNLCIGVCPTGAARPTALSAVWWGSRLGDAFRVEQPFVVLACQRRAGALESSLEVQGAHVEVIRFRCVGQIDAAMLLDLKRLGARGVLVAGCSTGRCRFGSGARLAAEQTDRARAILAFLGGERYRLVSDWSGDRAGDRLETAMLRLIQGGADTGTSGETAVAH